MNTAISVSGDFTISHASFQCTGAYNNRQWLINAGWTSGKETLSPGDIFAAIFNTNTPFDPDHLLPEINLSQVTASLSPGKAFGFSCYSSVNWPAPFGIPLGLAIRELGFIFQYTSGQSSTTQATGTVEVGGNSVDILCYFSGASPVFILVDQIPALSLSSVFTQFFNFDGPGNFIDISFQNSQIYYLKDGGSTQGLPQLPTTIVPGLNISSQVTLELAGVTFPTIDLSVGIASGNGILVNGSFNQPVGLAGFLMLTGANPSYSGGPVLTINSRNGQRVFGLDCGLQFLGENFGQAGLTISNESGSTVLSATLSYPGTIGPFTNPSLSMTYSAATGFQITNWPGLNVDNPAIDFAQLLSEINNNVAGCGNISLVFNQVVQTSFTISPHFQTQNPDIPGVAAGQFYIVLNGFYTITAGGYVVCSLSLPTLALSFSAPSDFSFSSILSDISQAIVSNGQAIVEQLYNNKQALAQFILVFVGKAAAQQLASQLCQQLQNTLNSFLGELAGEGVGVLGALGAAGSALLSLGCGTSSGGGSGGESPNITPLPAPVITSSALAGNCWTVTWGSVTGTNYYQVQVVNAQNKNVDGLQCIQNNSIPFVFTDFSAAPYTLQITAWANPGLNFNSLPSTVQLLRLGTVTAITTNINYATGALSCSFQAVPNATGYTATVSNNNGAVLAQSSQYQSIAPNQVVFDFYPLGFASIPGQYSIAIIATGGSAYIPGNPYISPLLPLHWGVGYAEVGYTFNIS
jgi:hypothetical protein